MMVRAGTYDVEGVMTPALGSRCPMETEGLRQLQEMFQVTPIFHGLCTGRAMAYIELLCQSLKLGRPLSRKLRDKLRRATGHNLLQGWPSIAEAGALFWDPVSATSFVHPDINGDMHDLIRYLRWSVLPGQVERLKAVFERSKDYSISLNPMVGDDGKTKPIEALFEESRDFLDRLGVLGDISITHSRSAVDITLAPVTKASAVALLLQWSGFSAKNFLGVGDSGGDEAWLKLVGLTAAPSNGRFHLPGLNYYSPFEEWRGLIDILKQLAASNYTGLTAP